MHYKHLAKDLVSIHVWRQTETQSTINNFYEEDMNILHPHRNERGNGDGIFKMEFPLMQWTAACLYKVFGNHVIITRIYMFIIGLFSVVGLFLILKYLFHNETIAIMGAWAFNFSPSFYYYTINPLPDNFALCCSLWGIAFFFKWIQKRTNILLIMSCLCIATAALCKLPFILYFSVPFLYCIIEILKTGFTKSVIKQLSFLSIFITFPLLWYGTVVSQWEGNGIVSGILNSKESFSTIMGYIGDNMISIVPESIINYGSMLFFLAGFFYIIRNKTYTRTYFIVFVLWSLSILSYFLFEINMIKSIHDYYLFPFYPILFIIVSYGAYNLWLSKKKWIQSVVVILFLILPITAYLRMKNRWDVNEPGFNRDLLLYKNELRLAVPNNALCVVGNDDSHFISFYYIHKKGWGFDNNGINADTLASMIKKGAKYLYSDSRKVEIQLAPYLDSLVCVKASIRVYKLKGL